MKWLTNQKENTSMKEYQKAEITVIEIDRFTDIVTISGGHEDDV